LASGQNDPYAIAVSNLDVYWINANNGDLSGGGVMFAPKGGGPSTAIAAGGGYGITVDGTSVYWTSSSATNTNLVLKAPLGGGSIETLSSDVAWTAPFSIVVDSTSAYWVNGGGVFSVPLDGGTTWQLSGGASSAWLAVDSTDTYAYYGGGHVGTLTTYYGVERVPIDAGAAYTGGALPDNGHLACFGCEEGAFALSTVAVAGAPTNIYQGCNGQASTVGAGVFVDPPNGGTAALYLSKDTTLSDIALDQMNVYWTDTAGLVQKVPLGGGPVTTLASGQTGYGIAVDANSVYWVNTSGTVMQLTPK
jgi:hypothetical protein